MQDSNHAHIKPIELHHIEKPNNPASNREIENAKI